MLGDFGSLFLGPGESWEIITKSAQNQPLKLFML
jgi:hypothetical protein